MPPTHLVLGEHACCHTTTPNSVRFHKLHQGNAILVGDHYRGDVHVVAGAALCERAGHDLQLLALTLVVHDHSTGNARLLQRPELLEEEAGTPGDHRDPARVAPRIIAMAVLFQQRAARVHGIGDHNIPRGEELPRARVPRRGEAEGRHLAGGALQVQARQAQLVLQGGKEGVLAAAACLGCVAWHSSLVCDAEATFHGRYPLCVTDEDRASSLFPRATPGVVGHERQGGHWGAQRRRNTGEQP
mmetsp:Transcript_33885/g.97417  ORF Transcript_33885/g.97417 Transcript_33885/m.97417 type:complete len:244 (-) Transcript_33885:546-1277(-)